MALPAQIAVDGGPVPSEYAVEGGRVVRQVAHSHRGPVKNDAWMPNGYNSYRTAHRKWRIGCRRSLLFGDNKNVFTTCVFVSCLYLNK